LKLVSHIGVGTGLENSLAKLASHNELDNLYDNPEEEFF